ncbi:MAG TPA: rod shape-determining protein MreC [Dehalococcoidia bacterium]|nr:rod shape-determining protein MreC [Dehalococcoidia bacterium]
MVRTSNAARLTAFFLLGLVLLALSPLSVSDRIEERGGALLAPATSVLHRAVRPLSDVLLHAGQIEELSQENADLQQQVARLEAEAAALREHQGAVEAATALRAAVGDEMQQVTASVVVRDPAPGREVLVVDRGRSDGVNVGQPVLGPGATLVGSVVEVQDHRARVRLLSDSSSTVAAVIQQSRVGAALAGSDDRALHLEFVSIDAQVAPGDLIVSSPLGGLLPAGLLIGRVTSRQARPQDLFATIEVEPLTDYARLEHVLIMTGFVPAPGTADEAKP